MSPAPNPYLQVDHSQIGPRAFYAFDATDPRFHVEAALRVSGGENVLGFIVVDELPDGTRGRVRGREFFAAMMDYFGDDAVDVIEGQWEAANPIWGTNLKAFNATTGTGNVSERDAAARVPTGKYATRRGFTKVTVVRALPVGARGPIHGRSGGVPEVSRFEGDRRCNPIPGS
jgi:hypothetical protein